MAEDPVAQKASQTLDPEEYREVIGHCASGVTVITSAQDGRPYGTTASAVSSLSLTPPMMLICMNATSSTGEVIAATRRFGVNILSDAQADLAVRFARKGDDKFDGVDTVRGVHGMPLLGQALATLECTVTEQVRAATHIVFLAEVVRATAAPGAPLAYFRGQFGRLQLARDDHVLEELRRRIQNRDVPIDVPMTVEEIAALLDLPRDAIHYALVHLTFDGLVTTSAGGRFVVRPLSLEVVEDALHARRLLELGAVDGMARRLTDEGLAELRRLAEATDPDSHAGAVEPWIQAYVDFHEHLVGLAGSSAAVEAYRRLNTPPMVLSLGAARAAGRPGREAALKSHAEHLDLVAALERGDAPQARALIERHYDESIDYARATVHAADRPSLGG
jgi:flavin reductase (DIM6/NTAB) family NADH-FMN oxidoreductase RutF/DNA-binding FadR family transcriptional regulator